MTDFPDGIPPLRPANSKEDCNDARVSRHRRPHCHSNGSVLLYLVDNTGVSKAIMALVTLQCQVERTGEQSTESVV